MSSTLAAIRAKLAAQDTKAQQNQAKSNDTSLYPFWNIKEGETASIRFLPDSDADNAFFWVEKAMIKLPFSGVKGVSGNKEVTVQVPCMEMYGESCPILSEVRPWYKDESLKNMANQYWKKRSYIFQGFVKNNPITDDITPENPIRRFIISSQLFQIIRASLLNPEIEEMPTHYQYGLNFNITKTRKGDYADYATSNWARRESALSESELKAIEQHGLFVLKDFLPKRPGDVEQRVIREMFEASVDGRAYDLDKWGAYYKPYGLEITKKETVAPHEETPQQKQTSLENNTRVEQKVESDSDDSSLPWDESASKYSVTSQKTAQTSDRANDIIALIRSRQK
jgi:hypothetical protein